MKKGRSIEAANTAQRPAEKQDSTIFMSSRCPYRLHMESEGESRAALTIVVGAGWLSTGGLEEKRGEFRTKTGRH